jgi:hypothetical protein
MADLRIGVRVSLRGRALKVLGVSDEGGQPRVVVEDEESGERFIVTTRVLARRELGRPIASGPAPR